jgi:hypothetical protein
MKRSIYTLFAAAGLLMLIQARTFPCYSADSSSLFEDTPKRVFEYSKDDPTGGELVTDTVSSQVDEIRKIQYRDMSRYYLKEIMTEHGIPSMALIRDTRINNESFYMLNGFLGKYTVEKILKSGVMLKDEKTKELFILKVNSKAMEPLESDTSAAIESELRIPPSAGQKQAEDPDLMEMTLSGTNNASIKQKQQKSSIDNELLFGNLSADELETRKRIRALRRKRRVMSSDAQPVKPADPKKNKPADADQENNK